MEPAARVRRAIGKERARRSGRVFRSRRPRRADLADAVHRETGLPHRDAAELVDMAIEAIAERLSAGETVMISGFGSFRVRDKRAREGRNPRTGEPAPIPARRVTTFRPSQVLKMRIAEGRGDSGNEA